jgi:L-ascorbate metabolism protein UlaG (beta-lactamase superfamily)
MDTILYIVAVYVITYLGLDRTLRARGYRGDVRRHFDGKRFVNIGTDTKKDLRLRRPSVLKWMLNRPKNEWQWRENANTAKPRERVEGSELIVSFINHASTLIQTEGLNILTDPIYSKRTSPFQFLGPKRYRDPGVRFDDLPPIDVILISHNHYDHMDLPTLRRLIKRDDPKIFVGLGNAFYLLGLGIKAHDMDWWDEIKLSDRVTLVCAPGQHFSSRAISDRDKTLWCGYVLETPSGNTYFAGDTGYGPFLDEIKKRYQSFRLGMLPIGAYIPQFFMSHVHMSPQDAYKAAGELNVQTMIPIHFGTFRLADDGQDQPIHDLHEVSYGKEFPKVALLENGDSITV